MNPISYKISDVEHLKGRACQTQRKNLINKLFEGSSKKFIAAFCQSGDLTEADINELKMHIQTDGRKKFQGNCDAYVDLGNSDENITNATILIICQAKNPSSEMKSGIQTLVSEKLALNEHDIRIDYLDVETFTSPDTQEIYLD